MLSDTLSAIGWIGVCLSFSFVIRAFSGFFFFQAEDGIRDVAVTGVQTCALPISGTNRPAFLLWWTDGTLTRLDGPPIPKFEWHHWVGTYDGTQMRLYIDGAVVSSLAISKTIATSSDPVRMDQMRTQLNSSIGDKSYIFSCVLNDDEIAA